jgi:hypothetical protein
VEVEPVRFVFPNLAGNASMDALQLVTTLLRQLLKSRAAPAAAKLALRQQVAVLQPSGYR